jgi:acyl-CoA thioesterase YciA
MPGFSSENIPPDPPEGEAGSREVSPGHKPSDDKEAHEKRLEGYVLSAQRLVMYSDLNAAGRLFGGRLMAWIDEASAMTAMKIMSTKRIVTKKFGEVVFEAPGLLGDYVEIWCRPLREGTTSITLDCRVLVRMIHAERVEQICRSTVVYVALDEQGRPTPWKKPREEPREPHGHKGP